MTGMDRSAAAWLITVSADHFWRVERWYDFEDLLHDGVMVWYRVVEKYETETGRVRSRPHIMRLFKVAFLNHLHTLSKERTIANVELKAADQTTADDPWAIIAAPEDLSAYDRMIVEAPLVLQPLLTTLLYGPPSRMMQSEYRVNADGTRPTTNSRLCKLVGVDPDQFDLATELRSYLTA